jgi:hypothetical protein
MRDACDYVVASNAMIQTTNDYDVHDKEYCQCEFIQPPKLAKASGRSFLGKIRMEFS